MVREAPVIFLYDQVNACGVSKKIQSFKARADEHINRQASSVAGTPSPPATLPWGEGDGGEGAPGVST